MSDFDFLLVSSWPEVSKVQIVRWGKELERRGHSVALMFLTDPPDVDLDLSVFDLSKYDIGEPGGDILVRLEEEYNFPGPNYLSFSEQHFFGLSRSEGRRRVATVGLALEEIFTDYSFELTIQGRGPEIHRLLVHFFSNYFGGASIWIDFSPFEEMFALRTSLHGGQWDAYRTVPYEDIEDPHSLRDDIDEYVEDGTSYEKQSDGAGGIAKTLSDLRRLAARDRPGRRRDQVSKQVRQKAKGIMNAQLFPSVGASRKMCENRDYVFLPLQYPIESRLTVFSPQFFDQKIVIEMVSRMIPDSADVFVKGHPHHPGILCPRTVGQYGRLNNVEFIHPELNAHDAIRHSEGVVVTNNTVGFQTIFHQTPLFVLGNAFYSETPAATDIDDLTELPKRLASGKSRTVPIERSMETIYSLRQSSMDGDTGDLTQSGVERVVDSLLEFERDWL